MNKVVEHILLLLKSRGALRIDPIYAELQAPRIEFSMLQEALSKMVQDGLLEEGWGPRIQSRGEKDRLYSLTAAGLDAVKPLMSAPAPTAPELPKSTHCSRNRLYRIARFLVSRPEGTTVKEIQDVLGGNESNVRSSLVDLRSAGMATNRPGVKSRLTSHPPDVWKATDTLKTFPLEEE